MEKEAEKFLQAEKTASELVQTLKQLQNEATSYKNAVKELDDVRQRLVKLIESTEKTANDTYQIIKLLKEIGAPEILKRIDDGRSQNEKLSSKLFETMNGFNKQLNKIEKLKKLILFTLASSVIAILLGLILLLK